MVERARAGGGGRTKEGRSAQGEAGKRGKKEGIRAESARVVKRNRERPRRDRESICTPHPPPTPHPLQPAIFRDLRNES